MRALRDKKEEEDGNPYDKLDRTAVLQDARSVFNATPVHPKKCLRILTKLLYLLSQGEHLGPTEATETFFAMTKLFQSKDITLRRMVYLVIKEMANIADDVIIVTSSLTKDMTGKEDQFRGPAIRALCKITDTMMLQSIERYMKQAIVDKIHSVSSAALTSSLHLCKDSQDVVRRWTNEAQEALHSDSAMVQYHAVGLLYHLRKRDKLSVRKMVEKQASGWANKSPYACCFLIRIAAKLIEEEGHGTDSPMFDFIERCTRHKSDMVVYEAAHAIVNLKDTTSRDLAPAVSVLQLFCGSSKPAMRYAAVKTLSRVAMKHPQAVTACNLDLEGLITDSNRSIATLAITTLLKTGSESNVERLMTQITSFLSDISDEFKTVVVQAIKSLCDKFPSKHGVLMTFLADMLKEEAGFAYKRSIVETIVGIVLGGSDAREAALSHLCEFIEDCEHTELASKILHLLGREGPRSKNPSKYIRYIYNRVILESAAVRAAAVTALAKFGAHCPDLLDSIIVLLDRCTLDSDDEVRDRATFYVSVLKKRQSALNSHYILHGLQVSVIGLERSLHEYTLIPAPTEPFNIKSVPIATVPLAEQKVGPAAGPGLTPDGVPAGQSAASGAGISAGAQKGAAGAGAQEVYTQQLAAVPALSHLGPVFKSSEPVELTESETEYLVRCVKHVFANHTVLQFDCTNTLNDQVLEDVSVEVTSDDGFVTVATVPCPSLNCNVPGTTYTVLQGPEPEDDPPVPTVAGTFSCTLRYIMKDCDPVTGQVDEGDDGYDDEYALEEVELTVGDHMHRVQLANFGAAWEELGPTNELGDTFALSNMESLQDAVQELTKLYNMQPCERTDRLPSTDKRQHTLLLAGVFRGNCRCLIRAKLALVDGVQMHLTVRSEDEITSHILVGVIG